MAGADPPIRSAPGATRLMAVAAALVAWLAPAALGAAPGVARFEPLGFLPGGAESVARGVSADGRVVVGEALGQDGHTLAFRWVAGTMTALGDLGGSVDYSAAFAASSDGSVVVGVTAYPTNEGGLAGFRWADGTMEVRLGPQAIHCSTACFCCFPIYTGDGWAADVSGDGDVAIGYGYQDFTGEDDTVGLRWESEQGQPIALYQTLVVDDGIALSGDGEVMLVAMSGSPWLIEQGGGPTGGDVSTPIGAGTAVALSGDGRVVAGYDNALLATAWLWQGGVRRAIPGAVPTSLSEQGDVVGGRRAGIARLYTPRLGWQDLQPALADDLGLDAALAGWTLTEVTGVSRTGETLVGNGIDPEGRTAAWRATVPAAWLGVATVPALGPVAWGGLAAVLVVVGARMLATGRTAPPRTG
jgi:probable HAF family extracellular repeat protein